MAIVYGTNNSETINKSDGVTDFADTIYGYGGNDTILGLGGNDLILGGAGGDTINGGADIDTALYTDSTEGVFVSLAAGTGEGGTAEGDTLTSIENLFGSAYDDSLVGTSGANALSGMGGADLLKGGGGSDVLSGGAGDDELRGGAGADTLYGGDGLDTLNYSTSSAGVTVSLLAHIASHGDAEGDIFSSIENVAGSSHADLLYGDNSSNQLFGAGGIDTLKGFGGQDFLYGGDDADTLYGMDHGDILEGGAGDDTLVGGAGDDTMIGGPGNDTYYVDSSQDGISDAIGQGTADRVLVTVSGNLNPGCEIEFVEAADPEATYFLEFGGNEFSQTVIGNDGENVIGGRGGFDLLIGRDGDDTYYVEGGDDEVVELGGQGIDIVRTDVSYTLSAGADIELLETTDDNLSIPLNLTGNSSGNQIIANVGNNVINGGDGDDELTGLAGQDSFLFDTMLDVMFNVDTITDFNVADDTIQLDQDIFSSSLGLGNISAGEFVIGTAAQDANDRIIYDSNTGALFYDSDGAGGTAAVRFAELSPGLALTHLDFLVV